VSKVRGMLSRQASRPRRLADVTAERGNRPLGTDLAAECFLPMLYLRSDNDEFRIELARVEIVYLRFPRPQRQGWIVIKLDISLTMS
jgi:hypothetical protein